MRILVVEDEVGIAMSLRQGLTADGFTVDVADNGVETEGSWGEDSAGNERSTYGLNGSSVRCEMIDKDLTNTCGAD